MNFLLSLLITLFASIVCAGDLQDYIEEGNPFLINGCITQSTETVSGVNRIFLKLSETPLSSCKTSFVYSKGGILLFRDPSGTLKPLYMARVPIAIPRVGANCPAGSSPASTEGNWCIVLQKFLVTSESPSRFTDIGITVEKQNWSIHISERTERISIHNGRLIVTMSRGLNLKLYCLKQKRYQNCED